MINVGIVEAVVPVKAGLVVAIRLADPEVPVRIGSTLHLGQHQDVKVLGLKFWPERGTMDALLDPEADRPAIGDVVTLLPESG